MRRLFLLPLLVVLAPPAAATADETVVVAPGGAFSYAPSSVSVSPGDTVTWTWDGGGHSVTFSASVDSGVRATGASYARTFQTAGTFSYYCTEHSGMTGQVKVVAPSPPPRPKPTTASPKPNPTTARPSATRTRSRTPTPARTPAATVAPSVLPRPVPTTPTPSPTATTEPPVEATPPPLTIDAPPAASGPWEGTVLVGVLAGLAALGVLASGLVRRGG